MQRIMMIAFACQPNKGSEYELGWKWSQNIPEKFNSEIITRKACWNNIPGKIIDKNVKESSGKKYRYIDYPYIDKLLSGRQFMRTHYMAWQFLVFIYLLSNKKNYDVIHHQNFVAVWLPAISMLVKHKNKIWGPLGTNIGVPLTYYSPRDYKRKIKTWVRDFIRTKSIKYNILLRFCFRYSGSLFAINEHVRSLIPTRDRAKCLLMPAIAVEKCEVILSQIEQENKRTNTVLFAGRYMEFKNPEIVYEVAKRVGRYTGWKVLMVGEGLEKIFCSTEGLSIIGHVEQNILFDYMDQAKLFLFPSFEGSGFVVLEAMQHGLPCVCIEGTGPSQYSGDSGIHCKLTTNRKEMIERLYSACMEIITDESKYIALKNNIPSELKKHTWSDVSVFLDGLYDA